MAGSCKQDNDHSLGRIKDARFLSIWVAVNLPRSSLLLEEKHFCPAK